MNVTLCVAEPQKMHLYCLHMAATWTQMQKCQVSAAHISLSLSLSRARARTHTHRVIQNDCWVLTTCHTNYT